MSTIVSGESPVTSRNRISKGIVLAIRELTQQKQPDELSKDLVAFIILSLEAITVSIDKTVIAWEKRDYWLKADKYRMEWSWTEPIAEMLLQALNKERWDEISKISMEINTKFHDINVSNKSRIGKPWVGAFKALQAVKNGIKRKV